MTGLVWRGPSVERHPYERDPRRVIHVDTGFLIGALRRGSAEDRRLRRWLAGGEQIGISVISWTECLCGPVELPDVEPAGLRIA